MNDLTNAENAALVMWTRSDHTHDAFLAAVRQAVGITEGRYEQAEDHRILFLREELAAVRDLAYRGANEHGARDAVEAIFERAGRALNAEASR